MLNRRAFIGNAGVLAVGTAVAGSTFMESRIKEKEIPFLFFGKVPVFVESTIFSDERRGVFGIRFLGDSQATDIRSIDLRLVDVKDALATQGRARKCAVTVENRDGTKEEGFLYLMTFGNGSMQLSVVDIGGSETMVWMGMAHRAGTLIDSPNI